METPPNSTAAAATTTSSKPAPVLVPITAPVTAQSTASMPPKPKETANAVDTVSKTVAAPSNPPPPSSEAKTPIKVATPSPATNAPVPPPKTSITTGASSLPPVTIGVKHKLPESTVAPPKVVTTAPPMRPPAPPTGTGTPTLADGPIVAKTVHSILSLLETYGPLTLAQIEFNSSPLQGGRVRPHQVADIVDLLLTMGVVQQEEVSGTTASPRYCVQQGHLRRSVTTPATVLNEILQTQHEWQASQKRQDLLIQALKEAETGKAAPTLPRETLRKILVEFPEIALDPVYVAALRNLHVDVGTVLGETPMPAPSSKKKKKRKRPSSSSSSRTSPSPSSARGSKSGKIASTSSTSARATPTIKSISKSSNTPKAKTTTKASSSVTSVTSTKPPTVITSSRVSMSNAPGSTSSSVTPSIAWAPAKPAQPSATTNTPATTSNTLAKGTATPADNSKSTAMTSAISQPPPSVSKVAAPGAT